MLYFAKIAGEDLSRYHWPAYT